MDREAVAVVESALPNLAVALTNALNHQDLQRVAALDPLTSVYNRRFGVERLKEEVARSQRSGDSLGLLILDLDHFKSVNDTYGHLVGDRVLQSESYL
ncbi:MAG: GGDEF domain-containing protein [Gammaproteobacteria bacterium]|nr:MAG: GGDEF domain-containing protein [Gammaproteobacteria bacterium]